MDVDKNKDTGRIYPWGSSRRFNSFAEHMRKTYMSRVQKVSIDAGFTCPNRDGSKGTGGCTYCSNRAFNPSYCLPEKSVTVQINEGIGFHRKRYRRADSYIAYFQAYSNTYAPLGMLEKLYDEALTHPEIKGLIISTRPDCINSEILDFLSDLSERWYISIEYGIESCYNKTLERINRRHTFEDAVTALEETKSHGISSGAHFIFGLPGESYDEMLAEAQIISALPLTSVKFHQLQLIKGTEMENEYRKKPGDFEFFTWQKYLEFITAFLERLNPEIAVERFTGEVPPRYLATEPWNNKRSDQIAHLIEKRLEETDTWQGRCHAGVNAM